METVLTADDLTKRYGDLTAVDGIDLEVSRGECFGFLGPNGAGKTTAVKMIHAAVPVSGGCLCVFGMDIMEEMRKIKSCIGVCPQEVNLDLDFSVFKNLTVYARYFGIDGDAAGQRAGELIRFFQLDEKRDEKIDDLSGGLKKRLMVARALINDPALLILDEPTTGLDPQARHQIWEKIRDLRRSGKTIILTTHYMEEAEALCDRLVIMDRGKIVERGRPSELVDRHIGEEVLEIEDPSDAVRQAVDRSGSEYEIHSDRMYVYTREGRKLLESIGEERISGDVVLRRAGLEDVFLRLTGRQLRE